MLDGDSSYKCEPASASLQTKGCRDCTESCHCQGWQLAVDYAVLSMNGVSTPASRVSSKHLQECCRGAHLEFEGLNSLFECLVGPDLKRVPISPDHQCLSGLRGVIFPFLMAWELGWRTHSCHDVVGSSASALTANWSMLSKSQSVWVLAGSKVLVRVHPFT